MNQSNQSLTTRAKQRVINWLLADEETYVPRTRFGQNTMTLGSDLVDDTNSNIVYDTSAQEFGSGNESANLSSGVFNTDITDPTGTTYTDLGAIGGTVKYNQSTSPSSPSAGETWYDNSSGIFRVYADLGSGLDWYSIPPVTVLEETSTLVESEVSLTQTNTTNLNPETTTRDADTDTGNNPNEFGVVIETNTKLKQIDFTLSSNTESGAEEARLRRDIDGALLESKSVSVGPGDTVSFNDISLESDTQYRVLLYKSSYMDMGYSSGVSYTGPNLDFVQGWQEGADNSNIW